MLQLGTNNFIHRVQFGSGEGQRPGWGDERDWSAPPTNQSRGGGLGEREGWVAHAGGGGGEAVGGVRAAVEVDVEGRVHVPEPQQRGRTPLGSNGNTGLTPCFALPGPVRKHWDEFTNQYFSPQLIDVTGCCDKVEFNHTKKFGQIGSLNENTGEPPIRLRGGGLPTLVANRSNARWWSKAGDRGAAVRRWGRNNRFSPTVAVCGQTGMAPCPPLVRPLFEP